MTLTEQLTYSLYIANCEKALTGAKDEASLRRAASCLAQDEFLAIPEQERCRLAELYSKRFFEIQGAFFG
jgi:hypothetical protein